jgi:acetate kinase
VEIDSNLNESVRGSEGLISAADSRVKVMVIPANEELVVAREAGRFIQKNRN